MVHEEEVPLTAEQRQLVQDNLGLVGVNLKRFSRVQEGPRRHRERDDLFQEGCLALMRAARRYPRECPIPFAAYALPRIRNAMSLALERGFSNIRLPLRRRGKSARQRGQAEKERHHPFQVMAGEFDLAAQRDRRSHDPGEPQEYERLGDRLRDRYDRAVRSTVQRMKQSRDKRGDLTELVQSLADDRLALPSEDARASLREIATRTRSSYARVHSCEQRMLSLVREALEGDPVFCSVRDEAMTHAEGVNTPLDAQIQNRIRSHLEQEFADHFQSLSGERRWPLLGRMFELSGMNPKEVVKDVIRMLSDADFETLLNESASEPTGCGSPKHERVAAVCAG